MSGFHFRCKRNIKNGDKSISFREQFIQQKKKITREKDCSLNCWFVQGVITVIFDYIVDKIRNG